MVEYYKEREVLVSPDTIYLDHLLTYVKQNKLTDLTNAKLREFGAQLAFYPGMPEFLRLAKEHVSGNRDYQDHGISVEHYIVSK